MTQRQNQIIAGIAAGLSPKEIGAHFGIACQTVHYHISKIYNLLNRPNKTTLIALTHYAIQQKLIVLDPNGNVANLWCRQSGRSDVLEYRPNHTCVGQACHNGPFADLPRVLYDQLIKSNKPVAAARNDNQSSFLRRQFVWLDELLASPWPLLFHYDSIKPLGDKFFLRSRQYSPSAANFVKSRDTGRALTNQAPLIPKVH